MGRINFFRVVLGGILAGILINISEYLRYDVVMNPPVCAQLSHGKMLACLGIRRAARDVLRMKPARPGGI